MIGQNSLAGRMDFDGTGAHLYIVYGGGAGSDSILVFDLSFVGEVCGTQFGASGCPCSHAGAVGHGCENSLAGSTGAVLVTTGTVITSADSLVLHASGMPPRTSALFFQGTSSPTTPVTFGDGALCVNGTVIRLGIKAAADGTAIYPSSGDPSIHIEGLVPSVVTKRHYQTWYRNGAAFCTSSTFNLTNAVVVEWRP